MIQLTREFTCTCADLAPNRSETPAESERKVVDLLVEQIECSDTVVLNKKDKCSDKQMEALHCIISHLNPTAEVVPAEWGKVPLETVVAAPKGKSWIANADDEDGDSFESAEF